MNTGCVFISYVTFSSICEQTLVSEPVTYVLFSSFAFLPSFVSLVVGHLGSETGHIIVAVFGIPLHPALLTSVAKLLVLVFPLTR